MLALVKFLIVLAVIALVWRVVAGMLRPRGPASSATGFAGARAPRKRRRAAEDDDEEKEEL